MSAEPNCDPGGVDELADVFIAGDVGLDDRALAAGLFDGALGFFGAFGSADIVDDDPGSFAAEALGNSLPYAGAGSGDDGDSSLQTVHAVSLMEVVAVSMSWMRWTMTAGWGSCFPTLADQKQRRPRGWGTRVFAGRRTSRTSEVED